MSGGRFEAFGGARVLITGGVGLIGSAVARRLVGLGAEVVLVDSMIPEFGGRPGARQRPLHPQRRGRVCAPPRSAPQSITRCRSTCSPPIAGSPGAPPGLARSEHAAREILGLPIYPQLEDAAVDQGISAIKRFF